MFNKRLSVVNGSVVQRNSPSQVPKSARQANRVESSWLNAPGGGNPMSVAAFGGPHFSTMLQGIVSEHSEVSNIPYYRDIYYHDSVGGAAVDISSTFPFSEIALTGLDNKELSVYKETLSRINIRTLMQEVSLSHLVDGQYTGTLVYEPERRVFQDIMSHDALNTQVIPQPFHSLEPVIKVNSSASIEQMLNAGSPYLDSVLASYPPGILERYRSGTVVLDPLTTLYVPRKGVMDRESVSYLKRILPMYMLEKVLYRGTLTEAHKRQRPTSHITVGGENWIATDEEMGEMLAEFQRTELDPLGAWIITREGVQVNDIRMPDGQWRWTDLVDVLVPYKLRALGISEAFLSGEASYATAETAITVFLDSMDAYRSLLTYNIFTRKIFPLVAVLHGFYKDPSKMEPMNSVSGIIANLSNHSNLRIPQVNWFKSLNGKDVDSQWDMLDKLSEKGFTIPLKMWAAAASVDIGSLLQDLEEDQEIKKKMEQVTGQKAESIGVHEDSALADSAADNMGDESALARVLSMVRARESKDFLRNSSHPIGSRVQSRRKPLLSREMDPELYSISKSGKVRHAVVRESRQSSKVNDNIIKAMRALSDPNHRASVRKRVNSRNIDL